jgi:hypothetical protein
MTPDRAFLLICALMLGSGALAFIVVITAPSPTPEPEIDPQEFCIAVCLDAGMMPHAVEMRCGLTGCETYSCLCLVEDRD